MIVINNIMDSEKQVEEIYYQECEPQIQEDIIPELDLIKDEKKYESCIVPRNIPKSAPHAKKFKLVDLQKTSIKQTNSPQKQVQNRIRLKRKMTYEYTSSPIKKESPAQKNKNVSNYPIQSRTGYINKKQSINFESISPSPETKFQRQSASPNRKSLYWQSYLLEGKETKKKTNSILKDSRDELPPITSAGYIAMQADSKEILVDKNIDEKRQIASLTKIMTAYTVITICNYYGIKIRQYKISIHEQASCMNGTSANLKLGEELFIIDLLYGLLLPSGNDAGVALAQYFGKFLSFKLAKDEGCQENQTVIQRFETFRQFYDSQYQKDSIKLFVFEMNKNSFKIGLKNTQFANPTGLSNSKNYSTPRDMAMLTAHCLKNNLLRDIFKKKVYSCEAVNEKLAYSRQVQWKNTNRHLYQFKQCIGVKTGVTPTAGPCLSSAYKILNKEIVVIVLNAFSIEDRYQDARSIYKWCRRNMKVYY